MGRKRWAERRHPTSHERAEIIRIPCGFPVGDGSMCMAPASTPHALTHAKADFTLHVVIDTEEQERRDTEELLNRADRMIPAKGLAEVLGVVVDEDVPPMSFRFGRRPTYAALKAASAERAQFTTEQAQTMLSAALGTRPHLAARVIDKLGPVLAGELARAVDGAVNDRIGRYLADEKAELNRIYTDQSTKLEAEREQRGRDVNAERWTTPSRLA